MKKRNILGKNIKLIRISKGITQNQLCSKLQVQGILLDQPMLSKVENHTRELLDYEIEAIAYCLKVNVSELFR